MKTKSFYLIIGFAAMLASCNNNNIRFVNGFPNEIAQYGHLVSEISVPGTFNNPNNQKEVKVDAFIKSPDGQSIVLPCFFVKNQKNNSIWQFRFTPRQAGTYTCKIVSEANDGQITSSEETFTVTGSSQKGFLSISKQSPYFLQYDNGELFRGLGLNIGWEFEPKWDNKPSHTYEKLFTEMQKYGANTIRMWICPWNLPIEWTPVPTYHITVDEFIDFDKTTHHSDGLTIHTGKTDVTQTDVGQLLITGNGQQELVYQMDSLRAIKMKLYFKGDIHKDDIELYCSPDGSSYTKVSSQLSDNWWSAEGWKRIFLYNAESLPNGSNYVKIVFKETIEKDNFKFSGIQFKHGTELSRLDCNGLGQYSLVNSEKMDDLLELAESKGVYLVVTLGYHSVFNPVMDAWGVNDEWQRNPYNVKNGGPCDKPADFFTNEQARDAYKDYLRYFVARWGYHPNLLVWEFWNEIDIAINTQKIPDNDVIAWHKEMSDYLNSIDPYGHMITTSLTHGRFDELWQLENMHMTQVHLYRPTDDFVEHTEDFVNRFNKPHLIGEYAVGWKGPGNDHPDEKYEEEFRDGMWRGVFSPAPVLPLSWWWDYHYDNNHYYHFGALSHVTKEMVQSKSPFQKIGTTPTKDFEIRGITSDELGIVWIKQKGQASQLTTSIPLLPNKKFTIKTLNTFNSETNDFPINPDSPNELKLESFDLGTTKDIVFLIYYQ
jgi:hypothetical protein